ncbi:Carbohydrate esterase family 4 protein [Venustampulla echinocandica]|uniref:chitin deacetylase n=1 Tax=Venustampulla echinocandica TaxID=2656787 RepID=A0A370TKD2_9HELO|nr:Carbohydrate esterase family 4 protein [Venustampulla echinocandica]RDL35981.1 Carbohydrate esterase family 4 protein [Venustampulla echinocandica]
MVYKPPNLLITYFQWKYPSVLFHLPLPASQRVVALTIDDAPSTHTGAILDLLKSHNATATFFIIGSQLSSFEGSKNILERMLAEGHEIGNHAWEDEPSVSLPLSELERQVKEVEAIIPANDKGAKYFRPGSGFFNSAMVEKVKALGYWVVLGSIYPHDPQIHNPRINAAHVLSRLRPGGIIIMHDRREYSTQQVRLVLEGLEAKEWEAVNLGTLMRIKDELEVKL